MSMTLDKNFHIYKATKKTALGQTEIGYYYSDSRVKVAEYLEKWDVDFDQITVVPVINIEEDIKVGGRVHKPTLNDETIGKIFKRFWKGED